MAQILVVDDEIGIRELLSEILADEGHDVRLAENAAAARAAREAARPDLVLLDIWMPDTDGITLLKEWAASGQLTMPVIMMSGHGTIDTAVEATRIGALDFLEKPIALQKLLAAVRKGLTRTTPQAAGGLSLAAFTRSAPLRDLRKRLEQVMASSHTVMLRSAPGGIAELAARTLLSPGKPWFDLAHDSAPLTLDMLERTRGGVLFADELGGLSRLQQKNLIFAAERLAKYDLRLIAATALDAAALSLQGWEDVQLKQIFGVWLGVPTLAELRDEVPEIAAHLLTQSIEAGEVPVRRLSTAALNALRQHSWPQGYEELKSTVKSLALSALEEEISGEDVVRLLDAQGYGNLAPATGIAAELMDLPLREARESFERLYFEHHLRNDGNNMTRLAERTGLERTHLYRKLKDLGLRSGRRDDERLPVEE
ncbi:Response regulator receiver protein [Sterolibacterium denitrificans]|uniref:Response regulator receiver protein n=1 Tax=Sterolibacterium denitrificans TaxID=157592 RepID=A0A7Z7HNN1_9PROT|nr:response regulator [Sterolibacterium denitrificans]SMB21177.1 Response regulator receiver protein [Sterolibacterium denitrificans]